MSALDLAPNQLLQYIPTYRVLICRECGYAIQKSALRSHLLRHKIYRDVRQKLLRSIAKLDLFEPADVPKPDPSLPCIRAMPILSGYGCTEDQCKHLTVSIKRMKRHWVEVHASEGDVPAISSFTRPVKLQTFFRGTQTRYHEVRDDAGEEPPKKPEAADMPVHTSSSIQYDNPHHVAQAPECHNASIETLNYFHHFLIVTSATLPGNDDRVESLVYWQTHVSAFGLQHRWLLSGLLAISASHIAHHTTDLVTKQIHRTRQAALCSEFCIGLRDLKAHVAEDASDDRKQLLLISEPIRCLLSCADSNLDRAACISKTSAASQLSEILSVIKGCIIPGSFQSARHRNNASNYDSFAGGNDAAQDMTDQALQATLNHLQSLPSRMTDVLGRPDSAKDVLVTLKAIDDMIHCAKLSFDAEDAQVAWKGVSLWLSYLPDRFLELVRQGDAGALIVVAYWAAVLVHRAERLGCWYLQGKASLMKTRIEELLSAGTADVRTLIEISIR